MTRLLDQATVIPLFEPKDYVAGADSETIDMAQAESVDIILVTGVLTVPGTLSVFSGVTAGAKTTALPFSYKLSGADYLAAAADQYGAYTAETDGILSLSATANDHRAIVIHLDAADVAGNGAGHRWVTLVQASGTAQFIAGVAILHNPRYSPGLSAVPTT